MARTFRRKQAYYEYYWVLRKWSCQYPYSFPVKIDPKSQAGRQALARFHSDKWVTMGGAAPRWYRKVYDHRLRTYNNRMLRRWIADPEFDPVFQAWHKHCANWSWW